MPRTFTLVSVCVHAAVLGCLYVAQAVDIGPLPIPREALAFSERVVKIADIARPSAPRRSTMSSSPVSPHAAPIDAPPVVMPETGREIDSSTSPTSISPTGGDPTGGGGGARDVQGSDAIPGAALVQPPPPPPPPQQPIHMHSGIQPPRKIVDVSPTYPTLARAAHQEGIVILETVIDARGAVETVRELKGYPLLDQAAVEAVRQWRFTPALLNGQPVPVVMTVTVNFTLRP
jgi:protein TonB